MKIIEKRQNFDLFFSSSEIKNPSIPKSQIKIENDQIERERERKKSHTHAILLDL